MVVRPWRRRLAAACRGTFSRPERKNQMIAAVKVAAASKVVQGICLVASRNPAVDSVSNRAVACVRRYAQRKLEHIRFHLHAKYPPSRAQSLYLPQICIVTCRQSLTRPPRCGMRFPRVLCISVSIRSSNLLIKEILMEVGLPQ